jgi:phosphoglucomutase/phosphomannomutase
MAQALGYDGVSIYEPQRSQDGAFPNVPDHLPNPERFAVFGPAIAEAIKMGVDLVLASDPDADRMAVAVRNGTGSFVCLNGNQLGALLTDYVLRQRNAAGTLSPQHFVVETLVTTPLISEIAKSYGVQVVREVLVGFKNIAAEIESRRPEDFVFAAEESIGFMAGDYCRDKDAAIGALYVLELAAELKKNGQTLLDRLNELYTRFGYYLEETTSTTCPGPTGQARIRQIMQAFRDVPPTSTGDCVWESVRDYKQHEVRSMPANRASQPIANPSGDLLIFQGRRATCEVTLAARPSGTEPKIKFYYFIRVHNSVSLADAARHASQCLTAVKSKLESWMSSVQ